MAEDRAVPRAERGFEFFLNQLRLSEGVSKTQFTARTGMDWSQVSGPVGRAVEKGLLKDENDVLTPTRLGWRFVNETQALFLP